ncbi:hypothetical protein [Pseudoalteromonas sp. G4]|uniref:hypothetical protein n=1 Tax=Pseudoalteromonas sp. G4 TaxID=2992761 RepID=UPI00237E95C1|nr:hypothetical protein [Pseudoalteromonas sp. G4]MDE3272165.1 hypothetical protein [Pseudoalteromonas sp. G4]
MYLSIKHYPEITNHSDQDRIARLAKPYLTTPAIVYVVHCVVFLALIMIDIASVQQLHPFILKTGLFIIYMMVMYLTGVNTWQRSQFLMHLDKIKAKSEQSDIALAQSSLFNYWQDYQVAKTFIVTAPSYSRMHTFEFGYLSLSENGEKAMIRVLEDENLASSQLKIAVLNEQVIPAVITENTNVVLTIAEQPINGSISKINQIAKRKITTNQLSINFTEKLLVVEFEQSPHELSLISSVTNPQTKQSYQLKLVAVDNQNFVVYEILDEDISRPLMSADLIIFENDKKQRAHVLGFSELASHFGNHYPLSGGEIR